MNKTSRVSRVIYDVNTKLIQTLLQTFRLKDSVLQSRTPNIFFI